ncbi:P-loop containing nucleoside triphosphate hydrolase, putative [Plasmodium relictum]|uniref:p-loop containing nucleoside triphosphate hydrolase, putative n=1 Tax=Plasmodium relictum TaxID=85471 RepID=A0A1J1H9E8_PLARL|nr:P-loop containing nucleoside triphosphate hydrolase, putative [Plasmodium relictum]CRH01565.1 P-loop containing nucleoside triphosphate hydrolase, putative [Plasmodium relictum]
MNNNSKVLKSEKITLKNNLGENEKPSTCIVDNENIIKNDVCENDLENNKDKNDRIKKHIKNSSNFRFLIEHIDFKFFLYIKKKKSDNIENEEKTKISKILNFIGKTYDFLKKRNFNSKYLKKLENSQYFEKILWPYYNMYDDFYILDNNSLFFCYTKSNKKTSVYIKHILSLIIFICYKYEEKGKYEIWDQIIYNKIDEFEKLVEIENSNYTEEEDSEINERNKLYKEFLIEKFNSLFFNTLKLINYNFILNEFMKNLSIKDVNLHKKLLNHRKTLFKLSFLEKSFVVQFFINIYSSIDKKFLFKLCLDLCNPLIWNHINYSYLNNFLFKKNKESKTLFTNLLKNVEKKYLNYKSFNSLKIYTCNSIICEDSSEIKLNENSEYKKKKKCDRKVEFDENIILFINKNDFFYNLINYFLLVLDNLEQKCEEFDEIDNSSISSFSENEFENVTLDNSDEDIDILNNNISVFLEKLNFHDEKIEDNDIFFDENKYIENKNNTNEVTHLNNDNINDENGISEYENMNEDEFLYENKIFNKINNFNEYEQNGTNNDEDYDESCIKNYLNCSSEDEIHKSYLNCNEYKKEEVLNIFLQYENKLKHKKQNFVLKKKKKKRGRYCDKNFKFIILFIEKCIEFFIDLLSQLYSRRVLYIFIKYFNVHIYCKISSLNKKRKFKELIKLLMYFIEMYIDNFSGNPLSYLEINNDHYKNFEYFQTFCYKYFKDHNILKNYYLKSVFIMDKKNEMFENFSKLEKKELLFLCESLKYFISPEEKLEKKQEIYEESSLNKKYISHYLFQNLNIFNRKRKLFYIILLIENLSFKNNIFEDINEQCEYPNEKDLFENILIDTKDDLKKKKIVIYTKPLFKLNLQYLCINDYIYRIYNLFKLQSYYDIRKNIIEYVYETNPKNRKVNENTICNYVFEIDENSKNKEINEKKKLGNTVNKEYINNDNVMKKKRKKGDLENEQMNNYENFSNSDIVYNEYQLNSIINDINKIENTYFANERRMSNKIDSFKIISVDNNSKKVIAEIVIDLTYKCYEKVHHEWNMIRSSDILFLVCVKNYTNHYRNKLNVIDDNDLKKLLGINYVRGCEVLKYSNFAENNEEMNDENINLKKITVYLDYMQYQKDILNNPEIYSSFNLLIRRKQKENNFVYILNNIKTLIMNPDDAVIPRWVHDIFLGYCDNSLKYYQKALPNKNIYNERNSDEENSSEESLNEDNSNEYSSDENISNKISSSEENSNEESTDKQSLNEQISDESNSMKMLRKQIIYNKSNLNFIKNNIEDINYLNTFLNIKHILKTTNVAYLCIDASYINVLNDNKIDVKNLLNEYIEPLYLSYIPIKYQDEKKCLQKSELQKSILESLFYHICIINKYKIHNMDFTSNLLSNIKVVYQYENFFIFHFEYKYKKYFLILNNYLSKMENERNRKNQISKNCQIDDTLTNKSELNNGNIVNSCMERCDTQEVIMINDHNSIKNIFEKNLENCIKHLGVKDGIYRIQNKIYDDPNYPLEGLLVHTKKKNSTNIDFFNKINGKNQLIKKKIQYTERQIECIKSGIYEGFTIIEGVPGSGKTSILNKIINILFNNKKKEKILICTHSNSCLNYIFNLLVKENFIHQKYLCRVGMGELDIENLRMHIEEIEKNLNEDNGEDYFNIYEAGNNFNDEDENFNFSKYGRINYMIDFRKKLLNEINLLSESINSQKIYNCLSSNQYYESNIKKRIANFFKYVDIFKQSESINSFFRSYILSSIDDYDIYNLFLCPKIYLKEFPNVNDIIWENNLTEERSYKEIKKLKLLAEDKSYFYLIHPEDQLKVLNLSIYNILFPFKKYLNLKLKKISITQYLDHKNSFYDKNVDSKSSENLVEYTEQNLNINKKKKNEEEIKKSIIIKENFKKDENKEEMNQKVSDEKNIKKEISINDEDYKIEIENEVIDEHNYNSFKGDANEIIFKNNSNDFDVCKYYLRKLIKYFNHLKDCRAFEVLKNQRERGVYIIAKLARVIALTCTHASINRSKIAKLQFYFDNIIIDECTQITENDTFLPLLLQENRYYKSKLKRIIFVGDSNQLPPIIKNKYIKNYANYEQSLYKRFLRLELPSIYLNEQGRMRDELCNIYKFFYSKYNIQIQNLECIKENFLKKFNPGFTYTYQFIHVESQEYTPIPYFYQNLLEAEMAVAIFMYMRLIGYSNDVITILTTYNGQKELILDILKKKCLYNKLIGMPKKVTTVDKYQGKQNDYVIISLVRSKSIGYLKNIKRLIVAFSRARFGLYVVGNYNLYSKNYEFKKPLYFFKKNKLELSLQLNEHFNTTERQNNFPVIIKDVNHFYTILYSLSNSYFQQGN